MSTIVLFEEKRVRRAWDESAQKWLFAIVDVIAVLTDSANPAVYWRVRKKRVADEGSETVTKCNALKMTAADGKQRLTDVAMLREASTTGRFPENTQGATTRGILAGYTRRELETESSAKPTAPKR